MSASRWQERSRPDPPTTSALRRGTGHRCRDAVLWQHREMRCVILLGALMGCAQVPHGTPRDAPPTVRSPLDVVRCDAGDGVCGQVPALPPRTNEPLPSVAPALASDAAGCANGNVKRCRAVSAVYQNGIAGISPDPIVARAFAVRACRDGCEGGDGSQCFTLGIELERSERLPPMRRGCQLGHARSCSEASSLLTSSAPCCAQRLLERACDLGDAQGCIDAAKSLLTGERMDHVGRRAAERLAQACAAGEQRGCALLWMCGMGRRCDSRHVRALLGSVCQEHPSSYACVVARFPMERARPPLEPSYQL